ncbi:unnamed protein product [Spirodela intermedia]|uniref:Uncharacterized protein n=1 Tax=Spirodela intermedia TaxID=51605 RepID=A0A7I8JUF5_SPIIN|nr:unnamed protein product [Spirodela intermedia]CAA6673818.1 unnamed protein product [Spirodela intermedia]
MTLTLMKWVVKSSPAVVTWQSGKIEVPYLACTTTPCPTIGWPSVTWKGSGAHVPLSVQAARAPTHGYSPTELPTCLRA